jgi:hypothetical protein
MISSWRKRCGPGLFWPSVFAARSNGKLAYSLNRARAAKWDRKNKKVRRK